MIICLKSVNFQNFLNRIWIRIIMTGVDQTRIRTDRLRLDSVLVDAFRSTGKGYQTKINEALWKGAKEMGIVAK